MSAPDYEILNLDLATARTSAPVVEVGRAYSSVCVLALPAGVAVSLAFGFSKPAIPLLTQGQSFEDICPLADEGLFVSNPAAAGILSLFVSYSGITSQGV